MSSFAAHSSSKELNAIPSSSMAYLPLLSPPTPSYNVSQISTPFAHSSTTSMNTFHSTCPCVSSVVIPPAVASNGRSFDRRRASWRCSLPKSYDHLGREHGQSGGNGPLAWKDRIALYAQFSAEETLDMLLLALRENSRTGPTKDDGIDALYAFANVDIWALTHRFFGKKMDLGQFERFKRVLVASPYDILLRYREMRTLSALKVRDDTYVSRRVFEMTGRTDSVFTFTLSRQSFGGGEKQAWMVDSIIHENDDVQQ